MSRPSGPPPYTAQEIALLDTPEKRFIAQAELNSYIMGHRMADLRDQGLAGPPTYNLTNNNGALVGFRRGSSPLLAEMLDGESDEEDHSPPGGSKVGPYRGRLHNRKDRGPETHKPYPSTALVGPLFAVNF
ncbi:hypothetical protein GRF29_77g984196 [Pseudopithomyces chartarum]|uniref:Uncharacterized protein n=1 Tax=Pseudopithomyces chartarum TaxID=1892770 RepID=A0AAN6RFQ3_9PLEO|nr:hypothetical protein GRF29_77g984196 [Pseudopithomyces chartarum]